MPNRERLLRINEAASRLGVHQNTLRNWADKGLIPTVKLPSGHRRFVPGEIERVRREMGLDGPHRDAGEEGDREERHHD